MAQSNLDKKGDNMPHLAGAGTGMAIGGAVTGGTAGRILFLGAGPVLDDDSALTWDDTDKQLVLGAGAVGKPSLIFGDDTTGYWRPSADALAASIAGALSLTLGTATTPDADSILGMGRLLADSRATDIAYLSHRDMTATTNYMIHQNANGQTRVNSASGQTTGLYSNNAIKFAVNTTGIGFFAATPAAQQNITGSRGGNAALADLLTKLATYGLITDGTTA